MKVSLIVAVYKDIEALKLIIESLKMQTYKDFEVIIAEDNNAKEMKEYVASIDGLKVQHTFQEDRGVRKSRSVNNAILKSTGEYLIFIDGDCIPYTTFIESHVYLAKKSTALAGRRVNLGPMVSSKLRKGSLLAVKLEKSFIKNFLRLQHDSLESHIEEGIYINPKSFFYLRKKKNISLLGCHYSCFKEDMLEINGLDESYGASPVADDTDIEWRLKKMGVSITSCRFAANLFHLYHKRQNIHKEFLVGSELTIMNTRKKKTNYKALIGLDAHITD